MITLLLLFKKVGKAKLGESDLSIINPKTPAPQYQPIERRKRKGKQKKTNGKRTAYANKKIILALLLKHTSPTPSNTGSARAFHMQRHGEKNKNPAVLRGCATRSCISMPILEKSTMFNPHWHMRHR